MNIGKEKSFPEIKQTLLDDVEQIKKYMQDGNELHRQIRVKIYGNPETNPPILGIDQRLRSLESIEQERVKRTEWSLKIAAGSITVGIGGAMIWIFNVLRDAFIKH